MSLRAVQKTYPDLVQHLEKSGIQLIQGCLSNVVYYTQIVIPSTVPVRHYYDPSVCTSRTRATLPEEFFRGDSDYSSILSPTRIHSMHTAPMICLPISSIGRYPGALLFSGEVLHAPEDAHVTETIPGIGLYHDKGWEGSHFAVVHGTPYEVEDPIFWTSGVPLILNGTPLDPSSILDGWNAQFGWLPLIDFQFSKNTEEMDSLLLLISEIITTQNVQSLLRGQSISLVIPRRVYSRDRLRDYLDRGLKFEGLKFSESRTSIRVSIDGCKRAPCSLVVLGTKEGMLHAIFLEQLSPEDPAIRFERVQEFCLSRGLRSASITNCGSRLMPFYLDEAGVPKALSLHQDCRIAPSLQLLGLSL